jgi:hypothetical protein
VEFASIDPILIFDPSAVKLVHPVERLVNFSISQKIEVNHSGDFRFHRFTLGCLSFASLAEFPLPAEIDDTVHVSRNLSVKNFL